MYIHRNLGIAVFHLPASGNSGCAISPGGTGRHYKECRSGSHRREERTAGENVFFTSHGLCPSRNDSNNFSTLRWISATYQARQQYLMVNAEVKEDEDGCLLSPH